jgi:Uma2 family endonuclease
MSPATKTAIAATLDDLYRVDGKAELVGGRIVRFTPSGVAPSKRADYFIAGTRTVWDVDPLAKTISVYRHDAPTQPERFTRGQVAHAEPAVPGWRVPVDEIFP